MSQVGFASHPKGLHILFFAELWERFSFYGLRALLILYMTSELLFTDNRAYGIYALYATLVYATQFIGGVLADQMLGNRRAIVAGGTFIAIGNLVLVLAGHFPFALFWGLSFIIVGTGLFKANISTLLGQLYGPGDERRDSGFTLFYVGINIGAFLAPLICGFIGERYGWHYGFAIAGVGMLFGLFTFMRGTKDLEGKGLPPVNSQLHKKIFFNISQETALYILLLVVTPVIAFFLPNYHWFDAFLPALGVVVVILLIILALKESPEHRLGLFTILILMFFHTSFFALFEQAGSSITLFTERNIDRTIGDYTIPTSQFQALNAGFIILLGPVFAAVWARLGRRQHDPYPPVKFLLALVQIGLAFGVLLWGMSFANTDNQISMLWIVLFYLLCTTAELCISPVGLSMVTKLAPLRIMSMMMGVWFLSIAFANYLAGVFARLASVVEKAEHLVQQAHTSLVSYQEAFTYVMYFAFATAVILLLLVPFLNRVFVIYQQKNPG